MSLTMDPRVMTSSRHPLQTRLAQFLAGQYPAENRDKLLSIDLDCDPRSARNYFNDNWPGARAWRGIVRRFGDDVIAAVFGPEIDETRARLAAEVRALEKQLEDRKAHLRALAGGEGGLAAAPRGRGPR